jgi:hypothetical protein
LRFFRLLDASNESILKSGRDIYLLSSPGRNAGLVFHYLDSCAADAGVRLATDTVYSDPVTGYHLLRIFNMNGWTTVREGRYGFETIQDNAIPDDRGQYPLTGPVVRIGGSAGTGSHSIVLDEQHGRTPACRLSGVRKGDLLEWSIKRRRGTPGEQGEMVASYRTAGGEQRVHSVSERLSSIHPGWELVRLTMTVEEQPADSTVTGRYVYQGGDRQVVDDFSVRHMARKDQDRIIDKKQ